MSTFGSLADREEEKRKKRLEILNNNGWMKALQPASYFPGAEAENRIALSIPWNVSNTDCEK